MCKSEPMKTKRTCPSGGVEWFQAHCCVDSHCAICSRPTAPCVCQEQTSCAEPLERNIHNQYENKQPSDSHGRSSCLHTGNLSTSLQNPDLIAQTDLLSHFSDKQFPEGWSFICLFVSSTIANWSETSIFKIISLDLFFNMKTRNIACAQAQLILPNFCRSILNRNYVQSSSIWYTYQFWWNVLEFSCIVEFVI